MNLRAPTIVKPLDTEYVVESGKSISLSCNYSAYPRADVVWLKENQPIDLNMMGLTKDFKVNRLSYLILEVFNLTNQSSRL